MRVQAIVNPVAGNRRAGKLWPQVEARLRETFPGLRAQLTTRPREATEIARRALREGCDLLLALGGDGTVNEVINGFFDGERRLAPQAVLGLIPIGTGADFVRSLHLPRDPIAAIDKMRALVPRPADIGRLRCIPLRRNGQPVVRYFMNVADLGFGGAVVNRVNDVTKRMGGSLAFLFGLLFTLTFYKNVRVRVRIDDAVDEEMVVNSINVANGQYFGGGMWVAPNARLDDGRFEIVIVGDVSRLEVLSNIPRLYRGRLASHPKVKVFQGRRIEVKSAQEVLLDADGEAPGKLPAVFEMLPAAVKLLA
jgi:YegS/Rv2252/BmrU family lipid kinase